MRLGICVVYMILPGDEDLLHLHLHYIEQCTLVPFGIYGAAVRLPEPLIQHLADKPFVHLCDIPPTGDRGSLENAYYLEQLIARAVADGCTHFATLHVDSFPIRTGWAGELARTSAAGLAFAAVDREEDRGGKPTTAGLFFPREFYEQYRPKLLITRDDRRSHVGRQYAKKLRAPGESGTGYGLVAFRESLQWLHLPRTNRVEDHYYYGSIHGDIIFHLGAAAHDGRSFPGGREHPALGSVRRRASESLPRPAKRLLRQVIPDRILFPDTQLHQSAYGQVKKALIEDPTRYLARLQGASRGDSEDGDVR